MRTYIVADQPQLRSAIQFLLDHQPNIRVVDSIDQKKIILAQIELARPELIMLDWDMLGQATVELLMLLCRSKERPSILVLSSRPEVEQVALQAGADEFICKSDSPEKLIDILHKFVKEKTNL
ncbi:MAG: response regulator [Anaerolineales bacterium]|nr:response regulator [Anaerolineales bacterium]